ncbi:MAG TPA: Ig-like domain-containing protein [Gemmatimonadales bacterium]|nr:Ig-like domain-containing protein [Gemmatimonadales bacterium]
MLCLSAITLALLFQQPAQPPQAQLPPSPVKRIEIEPANRNVTAGDSVQLKLRALDANGNEVPNAVLSVKMLGGQGEGDVTNDTHWLIASSVGKFPLALVAVAPGTAPFIDSTSAEFFGVAGPATRVELSRKSATIVTGQALRVDALAFSRVNDRTAEPVRWRSTDAKVATVSSDGVVTGVAAGKTTLTATAGKASATLQLRVVPSSVSKLSLTPAKSSVRQGDVVGFSVSAQDAAGKAITGLTPTWSFSPGDGQLDAEGKFVPYRVGVYTVTATLGSRAVSATVNVAERDIRRSVTVVGRLPRTAFATSEVWIHQNGNVAYLGTHMGGDRVYSIDITNPGKPVIVDSIQANTRLVNDMQTTADGNYMVFTREGAADRKNGIVIADTHDPLHPKEIAQFVDGVAAGVHSVYIYENDKFGKYVFITNDGTGAIDIVNITDPAHPARAGEWRTDRPDASRYVHDLDIVDGIMYASYWNDGLVILDIGNGKWGGRPDKPVLVAQYKYNLDSLYKEVEDVSGPGFARGTHTAWRQRGGHYVFISDEVYLNGDIAGAKDASSSRMYGTLQVVDVSDIEHPKAVAWYTPEMGGVHNVWQAGDTLYLGAYDAGFHAFDISGELKGDLKAQHREIASLNTADMGGWVKNAAFDWGVVVNPKDGLAYVNDFNNGLWVIRINPKKSSTPAIP